MEPEWAAGDRGQERRGPDLHPKKQGPCARAQYNIARGLFLKHAPPGQNGPQARKCMSLYVWLPSLRLDAPLPLPLFPNPPARLSRNIPSLLRVAALKTPASLHRGEGAQKKKDTRRHANRLAAARGSGEGLLEPAEDPVPKGPKGQRRCILTSRREREMFFYLFRIASGSPTYLERLTCQICHACPRNWSEVVGRTSVSLQRISTCMWMCKCTSLYVLLRIERACAASGLYTLKFYACVRLRMYM